MAKQTGEELRLFVQLAPVGGNPAVYVEPAGQGNLTINRASSPIDTSTKDTGIYGTSKPGAASVSIAQDFIPDLPDVGYARMKTLAGGRLVETYQVRQAPYSDDADDIIFECKMNTVFGNLGANRNTAVSTSVTLTADDAPTVDKY